jgi:hypothetical protein
VFGRIAVARAGPHVFGHPGASVRGLLAELPEDVLPDDPWLATVRALELHDSGAPERLDQRVVLQLNDDDQLQEKDDRQEADEPLAGRRHCAPV